MRAVWLIFAGLVAAMAVLLPRLSAPTTTAAGPPRPVAAVLTTPARAVALLRGPAARADSVVAFGLAQRGTPYLYAGTSPLTGFDCSGFILYTFARFGVAVPHSTALLIGVGRPVTRPEAQPGDIVVFTGTAASSDTPGHAGIVVSGRGEAPLRFVHASSARRESGVKVSQVEGTDYERRFMQVRRVLGPSATGPARAPSPRLTPAVLPVASMPARQVVVRPAGAIPAALPSALPTRPVAGNRKAAGSRKTTTKIRLVAKQAAAKKLAAKKHLPGKIRKPATAPVRKPLAR